jgi:hypothetical protein
MMLSIVWHRRYKARQQQHISAAANGAAVNGSAAAGAAGAAGPLPVLASACPGKRVAEAVAASVVPYHVLVTAVSAGLWQQQVCLVIIMPVLALVLQ